MKILLDEIPKMLSGEELIDAIKYLPEYDEDICNASASERLIALNDLYEIYIPSKMSVEIYSKLYLALIRSLNKKMTLDAIKQRNNNHRNINTGVLGGSDSFTIVGCSGIGKSSAVNRAINLISDDKIIEVENPYCKVIPCLVVQCPFDSSVKSLMLEILRKTDELIGSDYFERALKVRATTDTLIGYVSQVSLNHIGLLIVDEIQNVVNSKNGKNLVGMLTQLINNSGISIGMVGTPECTPFFEQELQLARRSLGLKYGANNFDEYFYNFCNTVFSYQYVKKRREITDSMIHWLYEHSSGVLSVVVSLIHDAQEIAILNGSEELNIETLNAAYENRLSLLHGYLERSITRKKQTSVIRQEIQQFEENKEEISPDISIATIVSNAKELETDVVEALKNFIAVEEIAIC